MKSHSSACGLVGSIESLKVMCKEWVASTQKADAGWLGEKLDHQTEVMNLASRLYLGAALRLSKHLCEERALADVLMKPAEWLPASDRPRLPACFPDTMAGS